MEPSNPNTKTPASKSRLRYILLGTVNAVAAIYWSLYISGLTADRKSLVLPLALGLVAGAVGGFLYHRIISTRPGTGPKVLATAVYLVLVLGVFAISMQAA